MIRFPAPGLLSQASVYMCALSPCPDADSSDMDSDDEPASYMPYAVRGMSDDDDEDALLEAVNRLDAGALENQLADAGTAFRLWPCLRSLCHAYSSDPRWEPVTALVLHAKAGTWCAGQPLPTERPKLKTGPGTRHTDNLLSGGVNAALLEECWTPDALRVLLSLGVPFVDYLSWDALLEQAADLKEHLLVLLDHFGARLLQRTAVLQRLLQIFSLDANDSSDEDYDADSNDEHKAEAALFLMRVFFRWHLDSITVEAWNDALAPVFPALHLQSQQHLGPLKLSSVESARAFRVAQLSSPLELQFRVLAEEEGAVVHAWCAKVDKSSNSCRNLLCPDVHSPAELLHRNPLLRFACTPDRRRSPRDELNDALFQLLEQTPTQRHTCLFALNNIQLLLQTYLLHTAPSSAQLRELTRSVVQMLAPLARTYYSAELKGRIVLPLLSHIRQAATAGGSTALEPSAMELCVRQFFSAASAAPRLFELGPPLRVLTAILSLLDHRHVSEVAGEIGMLAPDIARVHCSMESNHHAGQAIQLPVPSCMLPLFINFQAPVPAAGSLRQPTLISATPGEYRLCAGRFAPNPVVLEFGMLQHVFPSAEELVRALRHDSVDDSVSLMLSGREVHSDYLGPQLVWFTPRIDGHALSAHASRFGSFRLTVPIARVFELDGTHMRWFKLGTRELLHRRPKTGRLSTEWAHCILLTQRPAFAVGNPFGSSQTAEAPAAGSSQCNPCAIPELLVHSDGQASSSQAEPPLLTYDATSKKAAWRVCRWAEDSWDELKFVVPEPLQLDAASGARIDILAHAAEDDSLCHSASAHMHTCCHPRTQADAAQELLRVCKDRQVSLARWSGLFENTAKQMLGIDDESTTSAAVVSSNTKPQSKVTQSTVHAQCSSTSGASCAGVVSAAATSTSRPPSPSSSGLRVPIREALHAKRAALLFDLDTVHAQFASLDDFDQPANHDRGRAVQQPQLNFLCPPARPASPCSLLSSHTLPPSDPAMISAM